MTKSTVDKLRTAVDSERVGQAVLDLLGELSDVREWASALTSLADEIETAEGALQEYVDAEGREAKADAKEEALIALQTVLDAYGDVTALPSIDGLVEAP
jgi:hypothetical protein